jgi:phosphomethylpyrimidine synthase
MADINSPVEIGVTTGPIRGSRKVYVGARTGSGIRVAMREIDWSLRRRAAGAGL